MKIRGLKSLHNWFDITQFAKFAGGDFLFQGTAVAAELIILNVVSVSDIGIWQFCLLLQSYVIISRMGIINSFNREYVIANSGGNQGAAKKFLETTAFHTACTAAFQSFIFLSVAIFFLCTQQIVLALGTATMIGYTSFEALANFEEAKLRGKLQFKTITNAKIYFSLINLITISLPFFFSFYGLLIRAVLLQINSYFFYRIRDTEKNKLHFSFYHWKKLFADGWKFWILSYLRSFGKSMPKLFLALVGSINVLGMFTPVNWIIMGFTLFTGSLNTYLYPILSKEFALGNKTLSIQALRINFFGMLFLLPLTIITFFLLPHIIPLILPKYQNSMNAMRIVLFASVLDIISITSSSWYATKEWGKLFLFNIGVVLFSAILYFYIYISGYDLLTGASIVLLATSFFAAALLTTMIFKDYYGQTLQA